VPAAAVRAVRRTLLRHPHPGVEDPMDEDLARLVVAVVIAALHNDSQEGGLPSGQGQGEAAGAALS
jgi:hypothetical protein